MNNTYEDINKIINNIDVDVIQFHGSEDKKFCGMFNLPYIKTLNINDVNRENQFNFDKEAYAYLLDTKDSSGYGGTGLTFDWSRINNIKNDIKHSNYFVAGGLNHLNVKKLISLYKPYGIDVSSGIESTQHKKDYTLMKKFIENVRIADNEKR